MPGEIKDRLIRLNSLETIRNQVRLTPQTGTAGQPRRDQFKLTAAAGYRMVINLALPDHPDSIGDEGRLVTGPDMNYLRLPEILRRPTALASTSFAHWWMRNRGVNCLTIAS